jgi:uncharacterized membrane protein
MTQTPSIPPVIESDETDYQDSGVTSTVAIAGHPFHPLIVTFPIAFLVGLAGTDIGYAITQDPFWAKASLWLLGAGLLTGVLAAITGLLDFLRIPRVRKRSAGWTHMALNVSALGLSIVNLVLRWGNPTDTILPVGITLSIIVATLLGISGWYGAELVYRHKVAVIGYGDASR